MKARAIACTGPQQTTVIDIDLPDAPARGEVLVAKHYCSASPGTDLRCIRLAQEGADKLPFVMGYSSVGVVEAVGEGVDLSVGTPVFCMGTRHLQERSSWGAYTSHGFHGADEVVPVPAGVDLRHAALTKLAAISYHGLRLAQPLPHERVAVVGLGIIGQLAARLYHLSGAHVVAADPQRARQEAAARLGIGIAERPEDGLQPAFAAHFPEGADLVVDATGHPKVLAESVNLVRSLPWDESFTPAPRLLMQGSYAGEAPLPYQDAFMNELRVLIPRDSRRIDFEGVLGLMARGRLQVDDLVQDVRPAEDCQAVYDELGSPDARQLTSLFAW